MTINERDRKMRTVQQPASRPGVVLVAAAKGDRRVARTIITKALKMAGIPYHYLSVQESLGSPARFRFDATDEQTARFNEIVKRLAKERGFDRSPADLYHD